MKREREGRRIVYPSRKKERNGRNVEKYAEDWTSVNLCECSLRCVCVFLD